MEEELPETEGVVAFSGWAWAHDRGPTLSGPERQTAGNKAVRPHIIRPLP